MGCGAPTPSPTAKKARLQSPCKVAPHGRGAPSPRWEKARPEPPSKVAAALTPPLKARKPSATRQKASDCQRKQLGLQRQRLPLALQGSLLHAREASGVKTSPRAVAQMQPLAHESDPQHVEQHAGFQGFCIRCDVQRSRKVYEAYSLHNGVSWLTGGVRNGRWGLGCILCAKYWAAGGKRFGGRFSRFARCEVLPSSRKEAKWLFEQHQQKRSHLIASSSRTKCRVDTLSQRPCAQTLSCPNIWPSEASLDRAKEDDALLKGNVPSARQWRDAWSSLSERCSLRQSARLFEKRHSHGDSAPLSEKIRKRYRAQLRTMAELTRRSIRNALRQATSISLSLDESKYRKIIRFRADLPSRQKESSGSLWRHVGASGFCVSGVLGLLDCSKKRPEDFEEDHAVTALKQMDDFLTRFCTPLGRVRGRRAPQPLACDEELKKHIREKVISISADGCPKERRGIFLVAREFFFNILIVIRDSAHAIRKAMTALHCDDVFGQVWHELFDAEHALAPDLMHSDKWHNLLVAIQEDNIRAVARPGVSDPLESVLRNLAFAKQRFDSTAAPVAKMALMSLPLATLLAHVASDRRHEKPQRERATALLQKLDSKFCTATGVSADWGIVCNWFLHLFDEAYHDIAKSRSQIDCMIETLDAVFVEGRVFQELICAAPGAAPQKGAMVEPLPQLPPACARGEVGFITAKVLRNLRKKYVFYAGGLPVLLWGEPQVALKRDLLERLQNVASLTKERLLADFPRDDARSALAIFDRRLVLKGFGPQPVTEVREFMLRGVARLASFVRVEQAPAVLQYVGVLPYMIAQSGPNQPLAVLSNQEAWALLLDDAVWEQACSRRFRSASGALRALIRFYISIEDGECTVERDLGEFRDVKLVHMTMNMTFHDDMLMLKLNGPKTLKEFEGGEADSLSQLTPFSRECASLWRELYGARRSHFNPRATEAAKERVKQKPGFRKTIRGVLAAARLAVDSSRRVAAQGAHAASAARRASPAAGTPQSAFWNASMTKFRRKTLNNIPGISETRCRPGAPFISPPGVHLERKAAAIAQPLARSHPYAKVAFLTDTPTERPRFCTTLTGTHRCKEADLVVVPDLSILHDVDALAGSLHLVVGLLYIVSLGLDITTQKHLDAARGVPRNLSPLACVRHVPAMETSLTFQVGERLLLEQPDVHKALRRIMRSPKSKFHLSTETAAASGAICFNHLRDVVAWACSVRRTFNELGPKVSGVDGVARTT